MIKKVKKVLRDKKLETVCLGLCSIAFIIIGILVLMGKLSLEGVVDKAKIAGIVFVVFGVIGLVWMVFNIKSIIKYKDSILYKLDENIAEDIKKNLDLFDICYSRIEPIFAATIMIDITYKNNLFTVYVTEKEVSMEIDYSMEYIDKIDDENEDALKDYTDYEERYSSLNMTKEQFIAKVVGYINKYKDML